MSPGTEGHAALDDAFDAALDRDAARDRDREYRCPTRIQNLPVTSWDEFDQLPPEIQAEAWAQLALEATRKTDGRAHYDEVIDLPVEVPKRTRTREWTPRPLDAGAALDDIETSDYVYVLTGVESKPRQKVCCPLPGHDEKSPSFVAYDGGSFNCFGCNRGGTIFQFAAHLWGYELPLRGDAFREVRDRLLDTLR